MTPRGAAFVANAPESVAVRVWLDFDFPPEAGHLKWSNFPLMPEIVIGPKERVGLMDFDVLKGREVELIVIERGERYELARDRIATAEPRVFRSVCFTDGEGIREHIAGG